MEAKATISRESSPAELRAARDRAIQALISPEFDERLIRRAEDVILPAQRLRTLSLGRSHLKVVP
jgi:hypothetical protein